MGISRAKGKICVMLCADNYFCSPQLFKQVHKKFRTYGAVYERHYAYLEKDNSLNRYFSLIGGNDPVCYFLGKNDREPWVASLTIKRGIPSYGCNGFFVAREWFKHTDLNHYYPMDAHVDMQKAGLRYYCLNQGTVWHRTSDDLWSFMKKRYKYARDLFCERNDRRWKVVDSTSDKFRLVWFCLSSVLVVPHLITAFKGHSKLKDKAWFWHPIVCLAFTITYGVLTCRNIALSFLRSGVVSLLQTAKNRSANKRNKTTRS
jgi:glycosyltransferase involved in cell wall biosynthesis